MMSSNTERMDLGQYAQTFFILKIHYINGFVTSNLSLGNNEIDKQ